MTFLPFSFESASQKKWEDVVTKEVPLMFINGTSRRKEYVKNNGDAEMAQKRISKKRQNSYNLKRYINLNKQLIGSLVSNWLMPCSRFEISQEQTCTMFAY